MKVECVKEKLSNALSKAVKITGNNLSLPVLNCILLTAEKNNLNIRATNLDLGIEIDLPVKMEKEGVVAIPGNILNNFISDQIKGDSVVLESINDNLSVSTKNSSALIRSYNHDDFPTIPKLDKENGFLIDGKKISKGLKSVWYSASPSSMKPELSSVFINNNDGDIVFAATDSFRLAEIKIPAKNIEEFNNILIPFKNIPEILRIIDESNSDIKVYFNKNQIAFEYENIYLTSRIIDGVFPDYKQIIPKEFSTEVIVLKNDIVNVLKITNIFSDKFNKVNFKADPKNKIFEIKAKNSDVGENTNKIEASLTGEVIDIDFNCKYIVDCLQSINSDSLSMSFSGQNRPMVIKGVPDNKFTYLVMPMNK